MQKELLMEIKRKAKILKEELEREGYDLFRDIPFLKRLDIVNRIWKKDLGNVEALPLTREEVDKGGSVVVRDAKKYWVRLI